MRANPDLPSQIDNPDNGWVIQAENLIKIYKMGEVEVHALNGLSLKIARGEVVSIMGQEVP